MFFKKVNFQIAGHCPQFHTIGVDTTRIYRTRIAVNLNTSNTRLYWSVLAISGQSRHLGWKIRYRTNKSKKKKKRKKNKKMRRMG